MRSSLASVTLCTILTATTSLLAQQGEEARPAPFPAVDAALMRRMDELEQKVVGLQDQVRGLQNKVAKHDEDLTKLSAQAVAHANLIDAQVRSINSNTADIAEHGRRFVANEQRLNANEEQTRNNDRQFRQIAKPDASGRYILDLYGNMQSPEFKNDLDQISKRRVSIFNDTGREQFLWINGTRWQVLRGWSYAPVAGHTLTLQRERYDGFLHGRDVQPSLSWNHDKDGFYIKYDYRTGRYGDPAGSSIDTPPPTTLTTGRNGYDARQRPASSWAMR